MSTNFPTALDTLTNPASTDSVSTVSHASQHANANDAIEALQAKVGADSSAVTSSHDYKLSEVTSTDKAVGKTATQTLTNKTLTSPTLTTPTINGSTGTGVNDYGGADSFEIPNSATPTVDANGEIAIDTTVTDFSHGIIKYYGGEEMGVISVPVAELTSPVDGDVVSYDASADEFKLNQPAQASSLVKAFTASQDLTAGDRVGVSLFGSGVSKALITSSLSAQSVTYADTPTQNLAVMTPISGDKIFVVYEKTDTTLRGVVATVNRATMSVSLGTAVDITTDSYKIENSSVDVTTIGTDKVVVTYIGNADKTISKAVVCTVSGTTITVGTPVTIADFTVTMTVTAVCKLDTDKFAVFTSDSNVNYPVVACTVSGTTITVGTPVNTNANIAGTHTMIRQMTTDKFVLFSDTKYIQIGTVSGTTITLGTAQNSSLTGSIGLSSYDIVCPSATSFIIKGEANFMGATVSGTVATFGSQVATVGTAGAMRVVDSSNVMVVSDSNDGIQNLALSGNTITKTNLIGDKFTFYTEHSTGRNGFMNMENGYWVMLRGSNTTGLMFFIEGQSIQFIGVAQSTVSRGASVSVLYRGVDTNQSGLVAGETYMVGYGGVLTPQTTSEAEITPNEANLVKAISATSIII